MRFVLAIVVERGNVGLAEVARTFERTLAYHVERPTLSFDRTFADDLFEDIPAFQRARAVWHEMRLLNHCLAPDGVHADVRSKNNTYEVMVRLDALSCTCPAGSVWQRGKPCKHVAFAIHELLLGSGIENETRTRALYSCAKLFSQTLDLGTLLAQALRLLDDWDLIESVGGSWRATPIGLVAAGSGFDLLLVRQAYRRMQQATSATYREIAGWTVEDFQADERKRDRWLRAVEAWVSEVDAKEFKLPERYRGDFERGLEDLARVARLYEQAASAIGKQDLATAAREATLALRYGVAPELAPLMALQLPQLGRARCRYLYEQGVRGLDDLVGLEPEQVVDPRRMPLALVRRWVERASEIHQARMMGDADRVEADAEFDELIARFKIDPEALS
jgi:hypothetical protein